MHHSTMVTPQQPAFLHLCGGWSAFQTARKRHHAETDSVESPLGWVPAPAVRWKAPTPWRFFLFAVSLEPWSVERCRKSSLCPTMQNSIETHWSLGISIKTIQNSRWIMLAGVVLDASWKLMVMSSFFSHLNCSTRTSLAKWRKSQHQPLLLPLHPSHKHYRSFSRTPPEKDGFNRRLYRRIQGVFFCGNRV